LGEAPSQQKKPNLEEEKVGKRYKNGKKDKTGQLGQSIKKTEKQKRGIERS